MKKLLLIIMSLTLLNFASCRWGLDELPAFDEADINSIRFETRWIDSEIERFNAKTLTISNLVIDTIASSISLKLSVPPESSNFPVNIRNSVTLDKLVMICSLSNAATLKPLGSSPLLGKIGDFSQDNLQYEVTAADGKNKKIWTIVITDFVK